MKKETIKKGVKVASTLAITGAVLYLLEKTGPMDYIVEGYNRVLYFGADLCDKIGDHHSFDALNKFTVDSLKYTAKHLSRYIIHATVLVGNSLGCYYHSS